MPPLLNLLTVVICGVSRNQDPFRNNDGNGNKSDTDGNCANLDVEPNETLPGTSAESSPGVQHGSVSESACNSRNNTALEATVEGDDGVLINWQKGGLHTHENDMGRDDDEDPAEEGGDGQAESLPEGGAILVLSGRRVLLSGGELGEVNPKGRGDHVRQPAGELGSSPIHGDGGPDSLEGSEERRKTLAEPLAGGVGDDDVNPCGTVLDHGEGG